MTKTSPIPTPEQIKTMSIAELKQSACALIVSFTADADDAKQRVMTLYDIQQRLRDQALRTADLDALAHAQTLAAEYGFVMHSLQMQQIRNATNIIPVGMGDVDWKK